MTSRDRAPLFITSGSSFYRVFPSSSVRLDNVHRDDNACPEGVSLGYRRLLHPAPFHTTRRSLADDEKREIVTRPRRRFVISLEYGYRKNRRQDAGSQPPPPSFLCALRHSGMAHFLRFISTGCSCIRHMGSPVRFAREIFGRVAAHLSRFATCNILKLLAG